MASILAVDDSISMLQMPDLECKPLFIASTEPVDDRKQAGGLTGAAGWIVKPINPDHLRYVIRLVLAGNFVSIAIKPATKNVARSIRQDPDSMLMSKLPTPTMVSPELTEKARKIVYTVGNNR